MIRTTRMRRRYERSVRSAYAIGDGSFKNFRLRPTLHNVVVWTSRSLIGGLVVSALFVGATCSPPPTSATPPIPAVEGAPPAPNPVEAPQGARGALTWYRAQAPGGWLTFGRVLVPGSPATVVHLHATGGMRAEDEAFVTELGRAGVDAILACWYEAIDEQIDCPNGPAFTGVSDAAVRDIDALIASIRRLPGLAERPIVVTGLSRGGGVALLRATTGAPEAVVAMNPLVVGSRWLDPQLDTDVDRRVSSSMSRSVVLVTDDDTFVPPAQQAFPFVAAARSAGADIALTRRSEGAHGGPIFDSAVRPWTIQQVRAFAYDVAARAAH